MNELVLPQIIEDSKLGLNLHYYPGFFDISEADHLFELLEEEGAIAYKTKEESMVKLAGKMVNVNRKVALYGYPLEYLNFSGLKATREEEWPDFVLAVKQKIEAVTFRQFNALVINRYSSGTDYIGYHSDKTDGLIGPEIHIAGASFGAERDFLLKSKETGDVVSIRLAHGSLIMMNHPTNEKWKHSIPKRLKVTKPRVSLTFRLNRVD